MSEIRICKYCGMELSEGIPHGLRECHLHAVARIAELKNFINQLIEAGESEDSPMPAVWLELVNDWKERELGWN